MSSRPTRPTKCGPGQAPNLQRNLSQEKKKKSVWGGAEENEDRPFSCSIVRETEPKRVITQLSKARIGCRGSGRWLASKGPGSSKPADPSLLSETHVQ